MSRRPTLPGADELFRRTEPHTSRAQDDDSGSTGSIGSTASQAPDIAPAAGTESSTGARTVRPTTRRRGRGERRPTGRERHEEKITVYVSPEELLDLEHAKLALRAQHGLAVDRGRIVREAVAFVVADLEASGDESILVRRLRGL